MSGVFIKQHQPPAHVCTAGLALRGAIDDLWRCECGKLWRLADACDVCDAYGRHERGQCEVGRKWRPARLGQRILAWGRR